VFVGFFRNFLLMASFLGIGVGSVGSRSGRISSPQPLLLALVLVVTNVRST
jgi:hypothetical protein